MIRSSKASFAQRADAIEKPARIPPVRAMRSLAARAPALAGGRPCRHENTVRIATQPKLPGTQARQRVATEIQTEIDHIVRGVRNNRARSVGGNRARSLGECLGAEILRPAANSEIRGRMAVVEANARGRSPCRTETPEDERRTEYDFAHEIAPNALMNSGIA